MNAITILVAIFCILGAIDYLLDNRFGIGAEFERGFKLMGNSALSMIGMIVLAPWLAVTLSPMLEAITNNTPFDPSVLAGALLANDMGGAPLAQSIARTPASGYFNGLVVGATMGATISFSLPFALSVVKKEQHRQVLLGILCGIAAVPVGCFISGVMMAMPLTELLLNLLPLAVFAGVIAIGLLKVPELCLRIFTVFGRLIRVLIIFGLVVGVLTFLLDIELLPGVAPVEEGVLVVFNATAVISGMFPLLAIVGKLVRKPLARIGKRLGVNDASALGFVSSLATNVTTFSMMGSMDDKGAMLNSAFAVSGAFVFAGHLAYTMSFNADWVVSVIVGKLAAGVAAVALALFLYGKPNRKAA